MVWKGFTKSFHFLEETPFQKSGIKTLLLSGSIAPNAQINTTGPTSSGLVSNFKFRNHFEKSRSLQCHVLRSERLRKKWLIPVCTFLRRCKSKSKSAWNVAQVLLLLRPAFLHRELRHHQPAAAKDGHSAWKHFDQWETGVWTYPPIRLKLFTRPPQIIQHWLFLIWFIVSRPPFPDLCQLLLRYVLHHLKTGLNPGSMWWHTLARLLTNVVSVEKDSGGKTL